MKASSLNQSNNKPYLKLVKSNMNAKINRIYINTLVPSFGYTNHLNKLVTRKNCALI